MEEDTTATTTSEPLRPSKRPIALGPIEHVRELLLRPIARMTGGFSKVEIHLFPPSVQLLNENLLGAERDARPILLCIPETLQSLNIVKHGTFFSDALTEKLAEFRDAFEHLSPAAGDALREMRREHCPLAIEQYVEALTLTGRLAFLPERREAATVVQLLSTHAQLQPAQWNIDVFDFHWLRRANKTHGFIHALLRTSRELKEPRLILFICVNRREVSRISEMFWKVAHQGNDDMHWRNVINAGRSANVAERPWNRGDFAQNGISWHERIIFTTLRGAPSDLLEFGYMRVLASSSDEEKQRRLRPRDVIVFFDEYDYHPTGDQTAELFDLLYRRGDHPTLILTSTTRAKEPRHIEGCVIQSTYQPLTCVTQQGRQYQPDRRGMPLKALLGMELGVKQVQVRLGDHFLAEEDIVSEDDTVVVSVEKEETHPVES